MNERVVATRQRVSNPNWLVPNGAENRLQIDFETSREIDANSYPELPYCFMYTTFSIGSSCC
jgi:hypothetical protein